MKYKNFSIVRITEKSKMYKDGYRYRVTGYDNKLYGYTIQSVKEMIDKIINDRRKFERKHNIRKDLRWK